MQCGNLGSVMTQRLGGLSDVDPAAAPLPIGTEVITRVDREVEGKRRVQGAVGKVLSVDDNGDFCVGFVDGKSAHFSRAELLPRKVGLLRYSARRENHWQLLQNTVVLDALVGSTAWGLADESSDQDHRGVFVLPTPWTTGLVEPPSDILSEDRTIGHWEIGKAIRQALRADPNTLEMLFASPRVCDSMAEPLLAMRTSFVSKEIYGAFGRYALAQLAAHRETTLEWLRQDPTLDLNSAAEKLVDAAAVVAPTRRDAIGRCRDYLKQLYRSLYDQGLLASNEWQALAQFAATDARAFELPRDLRPKNAYNLIRLLDEGIRWLQGEPPTVRVPEQLRATLLAIKRGELPMDEVMSLARQMTPQLEAARESSPLPTYADVAQAEAVLRGARHHAARRWILQTDDEWGSRAAEPPTARYDE
jgi:hypothetical protein